MHLTLAGISGNTWGTGTLSLSPTTHVLTVTLNMQSLAVASHHAAMIHQGSCGRMGKEKYALSPLVGTATGRATSTTHISGIGAIPQQGWAVVVQQNMRSAGAPLACGNVGPNIGPR